MFKIGDFSKLSKVSIKALRYYDELGLLKPASVDEETGYRYYSASQLDTLNRIIALKDMGLSLAQITSLLTVDLPVEQMRGILRLRQVELQQQLNETQQQMQRINAWLQQFEHEQKVSPYAVVLKSVASQQVVMARGVAPDIERLGPLLDRLFDIVEEEITHQKARCAGYGTTLYFDHSYKEQGIHVGACMGYEGEMDASLLQNGCQLEHLPLLEQAASAILHGPFSMLGQVYQAVLTWIEVNGYQITGPNREINIGYERGGDQNQFVTEVQFPVAKLP